MCSFIKDTEMAVKFNKNGAMPINPTDGRISAVTKFACVDNDDWIMRPAWLRGTGRGIRCKMQFEFRNVNM